MDVSEFRRIGHRVIDVLADHLDAIEARPLFPDIEPRDARALFDEPLPASGSPSEDVLRAVEEKLLPNVTQVNHPGYMGLITPSPSPMGALGDLIASTVNQNIGVYSIGPAAVEMERRTVRWLTDLAGYDEHGGGHLTSGGTMANVEGLKLARDFASNDHAQHEGVRRRWAVYTSEERHVCLDKAVDVIGVGRDALRAIPTDDAYRVDIGALEAAIRRDRAEGIEPMCIVAMAGTTNTGSVDDLRALRAIADREGLWLHADAAYGGGMLLSHRDASVLDGLALADSIALDPHKWFYAPLDAGALLVKDGRRLTRSYGLQPHYLTDGVDAEGDRFTYYIHSFEQSRRFRALKVWMSFKRYGADQIGTWIDDNSAQARHLHERVEASRDFRAACPPTMSAICVRFEPIGGDVDEAEVGRLHRTVAERIQAQGRFWFGTTQMKGRWWFRINPVNFRTRIEHMDELFDVLRRECETQVSSIAH